MRTLLLATSLTLLLAGCLGSAPPVPRDNFYRLMLPAPVAGDASPLFQGVVEVGLFQAEGLLRERPLLYSESGEAHRLQQYDYHYWSDAPPRMLQDQMVAYLRRGGHAQTVVTPELRIRSDFLISGRAKRLERLLGDGPPRVVVEVEIALIRVADDKLLVVDSYATEELAGGSDVNASVKALNRATARVFEDFLADAQHAAARLSAAK